MDALLRRHYMMTRLRPASQQVISYRASTSGTGAASIAKIKGRTDAWNQSVMASMLRSSGTSNGITYTNNGDGSLRIVGTAEANENIIPFNVGITFLASHTYFLINAGSGYISVYASPAGFGIGTSGKIFACQSTQTPLIYRPINAGQSIDMLFIPKIIDLTLEYTAGREPATAAAFLAEYPEALTAPYNAGKLVNNKVTALVTDGFNQWDEIWEVGGYNTTTGEKDTSTNKIRSANAIKVFPSTAYCCTGSSFTVFQYDINGAFIRTNSVASGGIFYTESNCYQIRFQAATAYGTTYKNDIAINLSHSGIRNGEYEPYWTSTLNLDHSKIYGRLEGEGEMVQIAPNGFRGVGTNYDEVDIVRKEAYIRRAWVDLGSLTWSATGIVSNQYQAPLNASDADNGISIICPKYSPQYTTLANQGDKIMRVYSGTIYIHDNAYTDAAAFKTAMNGVMLDYQLATPLHYTDLMYSEDGGQTFTEIPSNYRVDDFGTERRLPDGLVDGAPASTPLVADIRYPW